MKKKGVSGKHVKTADFKNSYLKKIMLKIYFFNEQCKVCTTNFLFKIILLRIKITYWLLAVSIALLVTLVVDFLPRFVGGGEGNLYKISSSSFSTSLAVDFLLVTCFVAAGASTEKYFK